jgi:hypothetical protein
VGFSSRKATSKKNDATRQPPLSARPRLTQQTGVRHEATGNSPKPRTHSFKSFKSFNRCAPFKPLIKGDFRGLAFYQSSDRACDNRARTKHGARHKQSLQFDSDESSNLWTQFEGRLLTSWNNWVTGLGASAGVRAACHVYAPARKGAVSSSSIGLAPGQVRNVHYFPQSRSRTDHY